MCFLVRTISIDPEYNGLNNNEIFKFAAKIACKCHNGYFC